VNIEWRHPCASGLSETFKVNCSKPVEFAPWFSPHMRVKIITSRSPCKSSSDPNTDIDRLLMLPPAVMMCTVSWKMTRISLTFFQTGRVQIFGNNGLSLESNALQKVCPLYIWIHSLLKFHPESVDGPPEKKDRSKTITTAIPISMDADGCPELPTTTAADGYKAKVVQSMTRNYCLAHIRE
jgi:hypothetical protein